MSAPPYGGVPAPPYGGVPGYPGGYPPQGPPLISVLIGPQFVLPYECTLIMRERISWTNDDMDIADVTGRVHFRERAKLFSLHNKHVLLDAGNNPVCSTMEKIMTLHHRTYICPGLEPNEANHLAEVKTVMLSLTPHAEVFFRGNTSGQADLHIRGSFLDRRFQITTATNILVAEIARDLFSAREFFLGVNSYYVRILPGMDTAMVTVLVTLVEDMFCKENDNTVVIPS